MQAANHALQYHDPCLPERPTSRASADARFAGCVGCVGRAGPATLSAALLACLCAGRGSCILPRMNAIAVALSCLASTARAWRGTSAFRPVPRQPQEPLQLYEFESCPFCRLVREALTELDLDALIYPCPPGGARFREVVVAQGGKAQFPFLVDPNTGQRLYESAAIIEHLYRTYGARRPPAALRPLSVASSSAATLLRGRRLRARPSRLPAQPLELFSFESSPYARLVRETLCELELPYLLRNMGKAEWRQMGPPGVRQRFFAERPIRGRNRILLHERTGRMQVPYLIDPNQGQALFESADICRYLQDSYGAA